MGVKLNCHLMNALETDKKQENFQHCKAIARQEKVTLTSHFTQFILISQALFLKKKASRIWRYSPAATGENNDSCNYSIQRNYSGKREHVVQQFICHGIWIRKYT